MSIIMPAASKRSFLRLFGRKTHADPVVAPDKPLAPHEVAKLFSKEQQAKIATVEAPATLNESEKRERDNLSSLRRALYSKD